MSEQQPIVMFYNPFSSDPHDRFVRIYEESEKKAWEKLGFVFHADGAVTVERETNEPSPS